LFYPATLVRRVPALLVPDGPTRSSTEAKRLDSRYQSPECIPNDGMDFSAAWTLGIDRPQVATLPAGKRLHEISAPGRRRHCGRHGIHDADHADRERTQQTQFRLKHASGFLHGNRGMHRTSVIVSREMRVHVMVGSRRQFSAAHCIPSGHRLMPGRCRRHIRTKKIAPNERFIMQRVCTCEVSMPRALETCTQ